MPYSSLSKIHEFIQLRKLEMKHWAKWSSEAMHKLKSVCVLDKLPKILFYATKLLVSVQRRAERKVLI